MMLQKSFISYIILAGQTFGYFLQIKYWKKTEDGHDRCMECPGEDSCFVRMKVGFSRDVC